MSNSHKDVAESKSKVYFIRLNEESYKKVSLLARKEDRSINGMANYLLKQKLAELKTA